MKYFILLCCLAVTVCVRAENPPAAPTGFAWERLPDLKGAVLKPDGWFVKRELRGDTTAYFVSKEPIKGEGKFQTGLSLECVKKAYRKTGVLPSEYIAQYAAAISGKYSLAEQKVSKQGPFDAIRVRYVDAPPNETSVTIMNLLIGNDKTGTVYIVIFEAPTASWDADYRVGEVILKQIVLDASI